MQRLKEVYASVRVTSFCTSPQ